MIISNLTGGLGNQMFQYALGRHLAIKNKAVLKLHFTNALFAIQHSLNLDCFNIKANLASKNDLTKLGVFNNRVANRIAYLLDLRFGIKVSRSIVTEKRSVFDSKILDLQEDVYLQGYWQSERYFRAVEDQVRSDFTFTQNMNKSNMSLARLISQSNSVSIHIRRGDYVTDKGVKKIFDTLEEGYYKKAMKIIEGKVKNPHYFIFSNEIGWAKENVKGSGKLTFVDHNKGKYSYEDMRLISLCKHNVMANSTFSWWGSWLNTNKDKIVIAPKVWSTTDLGKDLILKNWIKI